MYQALLVYRQAGFVIALICFVASLVSYKTSPKLHPGSVFFLLAGFFNMYAAAISWIITLPFPPNVVFLVAVIGVTLVLIRQISREPETPPSQKP